jgi:predicted enzyme related to lactoylglutathione lyase
MMIGLHAIVYSTAPEEDRRFFTDVLGLSSVDAGAGWLVFTLPPAELAVHPDEKGGRAELYFMCEDLKTTLATLRAKGVTVLREVSEQRWGRLASIALPSGAELGIYEPRHPTAIARGR